MDNEKSFLQTDKKNPLAILLVIAAVLIGFIYFYSTIPGNIPNLQSSQQTPTSQGEGEVSLPNEPTPSSVSGCSCAWKNDYECGGSLDCKSPSEQKSFEKICECNPSGCSLEKGVTCGGFPEATLACTPYTC